MRSVRVSWGESGVSQRFGGNRIVVVWVRLPSWELGWESVVVGNEKGAVWRMLAETRYAVFIGAFQNCVHGGNDNMLRDEGIKIGVFCVSFNRKMMEEIIVSRFENE